MIRKASEADLERIMAIVSYTVRQMRDENVDQWSDRYPLRTDFQRDIDRDELFVDVDDGMPGRVRGMVCLNRDEPEEYAAASWSRPGPATVVHRLAVDQRYRKQGVALGLLRFAEDLARENRTRCIRSDTYSLNLRMNALFAKAGYSRTGLIRFPGHREVFYCYEKVLEN